MTSPDEGRRARARQPRAAPRSGGPAELQRGPLDSETRHIGSAGRDIYAVTAPIVVAGVVRLLDGRHRGPAAMASGEVFDACDVLASWEQDTDGSSSGAPPQLS